MLLCIVVVPQRLADSSAVSAVACAEGNIVNPQFGRVVIGPDCNAAYPLSLQFMVGRYIGLYPLVGRFYVVTLIGNGTVFGLKLERYIPRFVLPNPETHILKGFNTGGYHHLPALCTFPVAGLGLRNVEHFLAFVNARSIRITGNFDLNTAAAVRFPFAWLAVFKIVDKAFHASA